LKTEYKLNRLKLAEKDDEIKRLFDLNERRKEEILAINDEF